jgi:hypothetical protein
MSKPFHVDYNFLDLEATKQVCVLLSVSRIASRACSSPNLVLLYIRQQTRGGCIYVWCFSPSMAKSIPAVYLIYSLSRAILSIKVGISTALLEGEWEKVVTVDFPSCRCYGAPRALLFTSLACLYCYWA